MADASLPPSIRRAAVPAAEASGVAGLLPLAIGVVIVAALYLGREVLIPITLAGLLTFVLAPLVSLLRRMRLGRVVSTFAAVIIAFGVIVLIGAALGSQVAQLAEDLPRYQATIRDKVAAAKSLTAGRIGDVLSGLGRELDKAEPPKPQADPDAIAEPVPSPLLVQVREPPPSPFDLAEQILGPVLGPLATIGIILVVTVFILMQREDLRDRLIRLFGSNDLHKTTVAMNDAARRLSKYFLAQLALNAGFGIAIGTGLYLIGVPSFALWGIVAALMRFVPYIGAAIAALPPLLLAAAVDPGWSMVIWTAALFLVMDLVVGHIVEPMVYGHSTGLSPVAVVVSAIFWTWLWGPVGLLMSTPLTLCLVVLGRHIDRLEFIDVILGDRPALTPAQNCYQRLLAGDADEVVSYADVLLKERSLSSYYDEVVVEGLRLAAADAARGVMTGPQIAIVKETVEDVVEELDDYDDIDPADDEDDDGPVAPPEAERDLPRDTAVTTNAPPPAERAPAWRDERPVVCIAGRGPLDESIAAIAAQLLEKHGLGVRVLPYSAASGSKVAKLDLDGVAAIAVCAATITGTPPSLRYSIRRLRSRRPDALIVAGLWGDGEAALTDRAVASSLGADLCVGSLRDLVGRIVEAASAEATEKVTVPA